MSAMDSKTLDALVDKLWENTLTAEDERRLVEALADPGCRSLFVETMTFHTALRKMGMAGAVSGRGQRHNRSIGPRTVWMALAAAASLLLAFGIGLWLSRTNPETSVTFTGVARVEMVQGQVFAVRDSARRRLETGAALTGGERVVTALDGAVTLRLADGTALDVHVAADLLLPEPNAGYDLLLNEGDIFCAVAKRGPDARPFLARLPANGAVLVTGTAFEMSRRNGRTQVTVEQGRVRVGLLAAGAWRESREAAALQRVTVGPETVSEIEPVMPHEIAPWKFRPDAVSAGTVLFEDDFERGMDRWAVVDGRATVAEGEGRNGGRALRMTWDKGGRGTVMPLFLHRHRNIEIVWIVQFPFPGVFDFGSQVRGTLPLPARILDQKSHHPIRHGVWLRFVTEFRGLTRRQTIWNGEVLLMEQTSEMQEPFNMFAIYANMAGRNTFLLDSVVARKLTDDE